MFAIREHSRQGNPQKAYRLRELRSSGEEVPYDLVDFSGIKSEKPVSGKLEAPPRSGRGSGEEAWRQFAEKVSDFDMAILEAMSRDEIIEVLEKREIIPVAGEEEDSQGSEEEENK